jgi:hypothetical protein
MCTPVAPATQKAEVVESWPKVSPVRVSTRLFLKSKLKTRTRNMAQMVALSSIPSTTHTHKEIIEGIVPRDLHFSKRHSHLNK